jgi:hypothetical protein
MQTLEQIEASRLNGSNVTNDAPAKPYPHDFPAQRNTSGQGPATNAASLTSAAPASPYPRLSNEQKRQLLANSVTLPAERAEEFLELLNDYRESLQPVGFLEERVVETLTVADWYRRRYWCLGMAKVAHATILQEQSTDGFTHALHQEIGGIHTAVAVSKLADTGRTLEFFRRCDSGYSREQRHARKELKELQTDRFKREERERLSGPPDFDLESCFEKYPEPTEPDIPFRGVSASVPFRGAGTNVPASEIRPPEPDPSDNDAPPEPPTAAASEKIAKPTEPSAPFRAAGSALALD